MKSVVLAAGFGTRLGKLTGGRPKPLLPVRGRPILDSLVGNLSRVEGMSEIVVVTNAVFVGVFLEWRERHPFRSLISVVSDGCQSVEKRLGSVGDLAFAIAHQGIEEDVLVVGGDNLFDLNLAQFARFAGHRDGPSTVCYDVKDKRLASLYSTVTLEGDRIVRFREKDPAPETSLVGICVYYYPRATLSAIRRFVEEGNNPDASGNLLQWLVDRVPLYGMSFTGRWLDIGTPEEYARAQAEEWPGLWDDGTKEEGSRP